MTEASAYVTEDPYIFCGLCARSMMIIDEPGVDPISKRELESLVDGKPRCDECGEDI